MTSASEETYIGYERAERFGSAGGVVQTCAAPYTRRPLALNDWALAGAWTVTPEHAALNASDGSIVYRFHARDLHLVLGPGADGKPVRFRVTLDGAAPGESHGTDTDASAKARWWPSVSTSSAPERTGHGPHLRDSFPGPGCTGVRLHLRMRRRQAMDHPNPVPAAASAGRFAQAVLIAAAAIVILAAGLARHASAEQARLVPPPQGAAAPAATDTASSEVAVLAGGCFWGVQGVFQHVKGVTSAKSGYAGGDRQSAEYERVSMGNTGHAESVRIQFDPRQVSYGQLLQIYFSVVHDPPSSTARALTPVASTARRSSRSRMRRRPLPRPTLRSWPPHTPSTSPSSRASSATSTSTMRSPTTRTTSP